MNAIAKEKKALLDKLEHSGYITSPAVRKAMEIIQREDFLPDDQKDNAYEDRPLAIGKGQTISAPHMNAMMCSGLNIDIPRPGGKMTVLEIGTGSGYHAVLCAEILRHSNPSSHVYTVERIPDLGDRASAIIKKTGYDDMITVIVRDGTLGYPEKAPFDRIMVTAAAPRIPDALFEQLAEGGIMLIPVGEKHGYQELLSITKENNGVKQKNICGVAFVPLVGSQGFDE